MRGIHTKNFFSIRERGKSGQTEEGKCIQHFLALG
jgi:hypothetical protein